MASGPADARGACDADSDRISEGGVSSVDILSEISMSSLSVASHDECFRSIQHSEGSFQKIEQYFKQGHLTDVVLIAGSKRIPAHRLVLSASSEYFAAMFTNNLREATQAEIELQDVDGDALYALVLYCYSGKIELFEDTVEALLGTACLLQLTEVINACCGFLKKQLHPSNCIGIRLFAEARNCADLMKVSEDYTAEYFMEVMKNQEFLMLSADEVTKILASDDLNVPSEEVIFHAVLAWLEYDQAARSAEVDKLLGFVRLPLLSPAFIVDQIESRPIFSSSRECQKLILEAFKFNLLPERRMSLQSSRTCPRKSTLSSLYAIGGFDGYKGGAKEVGIEKYDCRKNCWTQVTNMNGRRLQFGTAAIDGKLYIVGGRDGLKTLNSFESCDLRTNTWTCLPPMSTHRHGLGVCVLGGPLYAVGGHDGWSYLNTVERFDPSSKTWSYVAPMSTQRSTHGVAVLNGKVYAVGGRDGSFCLKTVECFDPFTNRWTNCASMTKRRGGVGVGVANGFLYAIGGHDAPGLNPTATRFDCVERYDPQTDTWTMVASMSICRDSMGICLLGERLFAIGGYDGAAYCKLVEAYDPQTNKWTILAPLNGERAGPGLVALNLNH